MIILINKRTIVVVVAIILILLLIISGVVIYSRSSRDSSVSSYERLEKPIEKGNNQNYIAFACNVDWGNEVLPEMLTVLREKNIKITFFVTGRWVKEFPELFMTIVNEGHEIGSHGYKHLNYGTLTQKQNEEQIQLAEDLIMKYTKEKPILFAPPSGSYNENTLLAADKLGYKTILWTIDTIDWRSGSTKDLIVKRVIEKESLGGSIVLMHPMDETAKALPELIDALLEKNLTVGRVSDVLN
ncbi:polysaccharide deacetylase family protein [Alkaliphilus serpentinus]|uniref:Polysaccharide deacetylase family protein n=1 Tax=Alkaliphilus serpentinus TaxID=1482731 RepID=A0A833HPW0_9FIRM|nr:polysaccharide deacetylase family protein [Alkaliphilus serpentinus]KAB3531331.1 polysaccharide deacetylase family protein [Alkaliphilus serpentinus]